MLEEIVVVGYGVQKKATLSGSVTQVKGDEVLAGKSTQSVASALQGTIPGLTISYSISESSLKTIFSGFPVIFTSCV